MSIEEMYARKRKEIRNALGDDDFCKIERSLNDVERLLEDAESEKEDAEGATKDAKEEIAEIKGGDCPFCGGFLLAGQLPQDCIHCARRDRETAEHYRRNPRIPPPKKKIRICLKK